jgi:hypothetical protein
LKRPTDRTKTKGEKMNTMTQSQAMVKKFESLGNQAKAQLFFCGGHGGLVTYDGKGGPLTKEGGPIDRVFFLGDQGDTGGALAFDIAYGAFKFVSGPLAQEVEITSRQGHDTVVLFAFDGNQDANAVQITGGVTELNLPYSTVLFQAALEPSMMRWIVGDVTKTHGSLPYIAYHHNVLVHPALLKSFALTKDSILGACSSWEKTPSTDMIFSKNAKQGVAFRTQQHLSGIRILIR